MRHAFLLKIFSILTLVIFTSTLAWAQAEKPATPAPVSANDDNASIMLLKQGHTETVRAKAARDLGKSGNVTAIPALAGALGDSSSKVRREVVLALFQFHQVAVLPPLEQAARDLDDGIRIMAVQCLVGYYSGIPPNSGFTGFVKKSWERAATHFQPDDTRIDPEVTVDPTVVTTLIAVLKDRRSNEASREAAKGLGILLARDATAELVSTAHSSNADLAREALNSLAKIKDRDAGPRLVDLLGSPNKDVKRDACVTVGILRTNAALPELQSMFQNGKDQKDKVAAMQGLAYLGDKVSVPIFTHALWSDDKSIRQGAAEGLARADDPSSLGELQKAISVEKDPGAKLAMNFALAALGKEDALTDLVSGMGSKIRNDVARTYLIELTRNPAFLPKLYPFLQSPDNGIREGVCVVLMYTGDQTSLEQLDRLEHDPYSGVAAAALRAKRAIRARLGTGAPAEKA